MRTLNPVKIPLRLCIKARESQIFGFSTLFHCSENQPLRTRRREFAELLQLCVRNEPRKYYKRIHGQIIVSGLQSDVFLVNVLLRSYWKSGCIGSAQVLFDKMGQRNLITWSTVISMYAQCDYGERALVLFSEFRRSLHKNPNEFILATVIRVCTQLGAVDEAFQVHDLAIKTGFDQDVFVGTSLIDFYSKNGDIEEARLVFDGLPVATAVTWTTIIAGYSQRGQSEESLQLFGKMRETNVLPDGYVLCSVISACSMLEFIEGGKQIHAHVLRIGIEKDVSLVNVLIDFYSKCHRVKIARTLFDQMEFKNVISWSTIIAGYRQNSCDRDAMELFLEMVRLGWKPDGYTCTSILTSCGSMEALEQGKQVHSYVIKANLESDEFVKIGLVDMYAKCDSLADARKAFDFMRTHNVISYNAMIEGYARHDRIFEAFDLLHEMRLRSFPPSLLTFISLLGVSASLSIINTSKQIHGLLIKFGVSLDIYAGSALVDVYSKCSCVEDARLVFNAMNEKDIVVWNAMVSGYAHNGDSKEALKLYMELQCSRLKPNEFTFVSIITAASNLASLAYGQKFHTHLIKTGLDSEPYISNTLVDMYAKCGSIEEACKMFDSTYERDVVSWNSIISIYAQHGDAEEALQMFELMIKQGVEPNYVTFISVLSACSHAGLVESGLHHFYSMKPEFGIEPGMEHYACVVALLGRAGKLYKAKEFIEQMPVEPEADVWRSLLSACRLSSDIEIGKYAAEMAISIDPNDSGSFVLLSNIFASRGMWGDVDKVRKRMDSIGVAKEPGHSWIEVNGKIHVFISRDKAHSQKVLIHSVLDILVQHIRGIGYVPDTLTPQMND